MNQSTLVLGTLLTLIMAGGTLTGCASLGPASRAAPLQKRVTELEKELKRRDARIQDLRERNWILERKAGVASSGANPGDSRTNASGRSSPMPAAVPVPFDPSAAIEKNESTPASSLDLSVPVGAQGVGSMNVPMAAGSAKKTGEHFLYSKVLETYRSRNPIELQKSLQLLLKTYPDSVFADNSLYLAGLLAMEMGELDSATRAMDRVVKSYPRGNKAVAAMFALAAIEKRRQKIGEARKTLNKIRTMYPGSPEAARVAVELKLLETSASKKREI